MICNLILKKLSLFFCLCSCRKKEFVLDMNLIRWNLVPLVDGLQPGRRG